MSNSDYDVGSSGTDSETDSYSIAYTVSDELSLSYGVEEIDEGSAVNPEYSAEYSGFTADPSSISSTP